MDILVIDNDLEAVDLITRAVREAGGLVTVQPDRNRVLDMEGLDKLDAIFLDYSSLSSPKKYILDLKSKHNSLAYLVFMGGQESVKEAMSAGVNAYLPKPVDKQTAQQIASQAVKFKDLARGLADPDRRFPYHKGIISNTAMNELFLAFIDRTTRYAEDSFLLGFTLKNASQLKEDYGEKVRDQACHWMSNTLIRLRRQSDLMAQIGENEYVIFIQRPSYKDEPLEAAQRFRSSFLQRPVGDIPRYEGSPITLDIRINALRLPQAESIFSETVICPG